MGCIPWCVDAQNTLWIMGIEDFWIGVLLFLLTLLTQWSILWFMRSKFQNFRIIEYFWISWIRDFLYIQISHKINLFAEITFLVTDQGWMEAKIGKYRWNSWMFLHDFLGSRWARELKLCRNTPQYANLKPWKFQLKTRKKNFFDKMIHFMDHLGQEGVWGQEC